MEWSEIYVMRIKNKRKILKVITICGDPAPIWSPHKRKFYSSKKLRELNEAKKGLRSGKARRRTKKAK